MQCNVQITPLGAGQEVGRSCILLSFFDEKHILLDCGVHMGYKDQRKYPNFRFLQDHLKTSDLNSKIDFLLLSHFHLDHCAALPFLIHKFNFSNKIYTSEPTRAILPYMLNDFIRVSKDPFFKANERHVVQVMNSVQSLTLNAEYNINGVKISSFYAGHVLGAVMFLIEYKGVRVLYTGDFNSAADRHLAALKVPQCQPDVVISESTYATIMKDWKKQREMQFMCLAKKTLERSGKILIPVFALGRAQELMILIDDLWEKTGWQVPVYYAGRLVERVQFYYKLFLPWTNQNLQRSAMQQMKRLSGFTRFQPLPKGAELTSGSIVVLATPGMLHAGRSLELFKRMCTDSKNSLLIPGFCVKGTYGARLLSGEKKLKIHEMDYHVQMEIAKMSFSAHADSKGITDLMDYLQPKHVVLVHGEKKRMFELIENTKKQGKTYQCHMPGNHQTINIPITFGNSIQVKKKYISKINRSHIKSKLQKRSMIKNSDNEKKKASFKDSKSEFKNLKGLNKGNNLKSLDNQLFLKNNGHKNSKKITRSFDVEFDWSLVGGHQNIKKGDFIQVVKENQKLKVLKVQKKNKIVIRRIFKKS